MTRYFDEDYVLNTFRALLAIDSTTGQFRQVQDWIVGEIERLRFAPRATHKGGVIADLGGEGEPLVITAHVDDIGPMVRKINADGTLNVCNVGGLYPFYCMGGRMCACTRAAARYTPVPYAARPIPCT